MVLLLQAELSDRQMDKAGLIGLKAMPLHQEVEHGYRESQPSPKVGPNPMSDLFEMANGREHGQDPFDNHADIKCRVVKLSC